MVPTDLIATAREAIARNEWTEAYELLENAAATVGLDPEGFEDLARCAWWSGLPDECIDARERAYAGYIKSDQPEEPRCSRWTWRKVISIKRPSLLAVVGSNAPNAYSSRSQSRSSTATWPAPRR